MAFKQPRVPEYREGENVVKYLKALVLFLKDFCEDAWVANRNAGKALDKGLSSIKIEYPVTSVNKKTGDVVLGASDVGARPATWKPYTIDSYDGTSFIEAQGADGYIRGYASWTTVGEKRYRIITYTEPDTKKHHISLYDKSEDTWYDKIVVTIDALYPVGSIYLSVDSTSPASLFGGTWEQITNRFLLAAGSSYTAGSTGGAATVKLTAAQSGVGAHTHRIVGGESGTSRLWSSLGSYSDTASENYGPWFGGGYSAVDNVYTTSVSADASSAHNNMPPYLAVYMWKRVS